MRIIRVVNLKKIMTAGVLFLSLLILLTPTVYGVNPMQPQFNNNVTSDWRAQNEPMIAINPLHNTYDPMDIRVAVGCNDYRGPGGQSTPGLYTSSDFSTWTYRSVPIPAGYAAQGDPCLAYDSAGDLYYAYLAFSYDANGWGEDGTIFVARSTDEGVTWVGPPVRVGPLGNHRDLHNDKPWMVIDQTNDNIYVSWTQWHNLARWSGDTRTVWSDIMFARSTDHGATFSAPIKLSPDIYNQQRHWSQMALGPSGEIYVVYRRFGANSPGMALIFVESTDYGVTFTSETVVLLAPQFTPYDSRHTGDSPYTPSLPQIAVDSTGYIYIVWQEFVGTWDVVDDRDIQLVRSTTGGTTWDPKITVNSNPNDQKDQFWAAIAVSPSGRVDVVWNDRRDDPSDNLFHLYYTDSLNQGASFSTDEVQVSTAQSDPTTPLDGGVRFFGDYISLTETSDDVAVAVWTDTRVGDQEIFIAAIKLTAATGDLMGQVTDANTGLPIMGATVTADGLTTTTDASGNYAFSSIPAGTYDVTAQMTGYQSQTASGVVVSAGAQTVQDFALVPSVPGAPVASFTESAHTAPAPALITFDPITSSDPDGTIVLYEWDFDGDGVYDHSTATPDIVSHTYTTPGTYIVTLRVTDNDGLTDTATDTKNITPIGVIPEVPLGTIMASAAMIIALVAYVAMPKWRRKPI